MNEQEIIQKQEVEIKRLENQIKYLERVIQNILTGGYRG